MRYLSFSGLLISFLLVLSVNGTANAQQSMPQDLYPETGAWQESDNLGIGFFLEIQNGIAAAAFFGYETDGGNAWLLFNGPLSEATESVPGINASIEWMLEATLTQSADGECIVNCQTPGSNDNRTVMDVGTIELFFTSRDRGFYRIDGGELREIEPFQYGVPATAPFENAPGVRIPDLQGEWLLRVTLSRTAMQAGMIESGMLVEFGEPVIGSEGNDGTTSITYPITRPTITSDTILTDADDLVLNDENPMEQIGEVFCANGSCTIDVCQLFTPEQCEGGLAPDVNQFVITELTDHRFFSSVGVGLDPPLGLVSMEGFRLDYD